MTPKGKKALLVIGSIVAIGGVVGYILWKRKKDKEGKSTNDQTQTGGGDNTSGGGDTPVFQPDLSVGTTTPNPFSTTAELKKFQEWVINTKKDNSILGSAGADGLWGKNSAKAWNKYGAEYKKGSAGGTVSELEQVAKNLGASAEIYTDKVIARVTVNGKGYAGQFNDKYKSFLLFGKGGALLKKGTWSDGGKKIVLSNGRIISSGSVWSNIRATVTA
jgi:hypothetical protein